MAKLTFTHQENGLWKSNDFTPSGDYEVDFNGSGLARVICKAKPNGSTVTPKARWIKEPVVEFGATVKNESPVDLVCHIEVQYLDHKEGTSPDFYVFE